MDYVPYAECSTESVSIWLPYWPNTWSSPAGVIPLKSITMTRERVGCCVFYSWAQSSIRNR